MLLLEGVRPVVVGSSGPPKAQLSFYTKTTRASEAADCTPDSIDCFYAPLLILFIWLLYFENRRNLFVGETYCLFLATMLSCERFPN